MDDQSAYRVRLYELTRRVDHRLLHSGRRLTEIISEYRYLIAVLIIGFVVWSVVFNIALVDYLNTRFWNSRTAWLGPFPDPGEFNLFGYTIPYQFEGYSDYSFYYVHWGYNILNGVMPYSGSFGYLDMQGIINENGAYMFPPFTAYLYAAGIALGSIIGPGNWGIGLLFELFGYSTTLPVYGIARELSKNPRVGEIAALTYTINPLVLYYIDYLWLNPAPFYFFFFAGFYALIRGRKYVATILIVTAALFKQTAWFLGIPLVAYLVVRSRDRKKKVSEEKGSDGYQNGALVEEQKKASGISKLGFLSAYFDFRSFASCAVVAVAYVGAVMFPFIIAQPNFLGSWSLALGAFSFDGNYVDAIPYNVPVRLPLLPIMYGFPKIAEIMDMIIVTSAPLFFGVTLLFGLMMLTDKYKGKEHMYLRRLLFLTMLLMLWTNLTGPRGAFKYYFTVFGPFFAIFSSSRMTRVDGEHIPFSLSMVWMPIVFSLLILIPDRNFYFAYVLLIFISYSLAPIFSRFYHEIKRPFSAIRTVLGSKFRQRVETVHSLSWYNDSKEYRLVNWILVIYAMTSGTALVALGTLICFAKLAASTEVILQFLLLMGSMVFVGMQILSIAFLSLMMTEVKAADLEYTVKVLSFTVAGLSLIYALDTFMISWGVESLIQRQIMIFSSMFVIVWTPGLVLLVEKRMRLLSLGFLLLGSTSVTWIWFQLGDELFTLFGCTLIAGILLISLLASGEKSVRRLTNFETDDSHDPSHEEQLVS
jgi:hypothetical protein